MAASRDFPGHVFVVKADVTTIKCDAWLCPTDQEFGVSTWCGALGLDPGYERLRGYSWARGQRAQEFHRPPTNTLHAKPPVNKSLIVLGDVGRDVPSWPADVRARVEELLPVVDDFVAVAAKRLRKNTDRLLRLAMPLIGTGKGGLQSVQGDTFKPLLARLNSLARSEYVDFILCIRDRVAWSAVQSARSSNEWSLSRQERATADHLATEAERERLVLFIGAGASADVGLPGWEALLHEIAPVRLATKIRESPSKIDLRDYATLIEERLGRPEMLSEISTRLNAETRPTGLTHALLASLGTQQAITTNYDDLFERACKFADSGTEARVVLPYERAQAFQPWLLKLHGSLQHCDKGDYKDIVLTRSDYTRLRHERGALYGIVQALLVTKHLLFVGYSLADDDFHELFDEIRAALEPSSPGHGPLGTVLTIDESIWPLWKDLLKVFPVRDPAEAPTGRRLQILLDRAAHKATPRYSYLLDPRFDGLLNKEEKRIANHLRAIREVVTRSKGPAATAVRAVVDRFGGN